MDLSGISAATSREDWIITAVCWDLDVEEERVRGQARDQESVRARQLLCYVLQRSGFTIMQVARLLTRDHSTILHAIRQVEAQPALVEEGQQLASAVLPFVDEPAQHGIVDAIPLSAICRALMQSLEGTILLRDVHAVRAYVCGTLLGRERVPSVQAAWGLHVIGARPLVRAAVEEVLCRCGLPAYRGLMDLQLQRVGLL